MTPIDIIRLSLQNSGALSLSQTIYADDIDNAFGLMNQILTEWQLNRWLVYDLTTASKVATGVGTNSYTVGPTGDFVFPDQRPDKVDAVFVRLTSTGVDTYLWPFQSKEGYDKIANKSVNTGLAQSYYYDPTLTSNGTIYIYPAPASTYTIFVQAKASLGQFTSPTQTISLPIIYQTTLMWSLAQEIRGVYGLPPDPTLSVRAQNAMQSLINSIAQVPQSIQPQPGNRGGVYSAIASGPQNDSQ